MHAQRTVPYRTVPYLYIQPPNWRWTSGSKQEYDIKKLKMHIFWLIFYSYITMHVAKKDIKEG